MLLFCVGDLLNDFYFVSVNSDKLDELGVFYYND